MYTSFERGKRCKTRLQTRRGGAKKGRYGNGFARRSPVLSKHRSSEVADQVLLFTGSGWQALFSGEAIPVNKAAKARFYTS
ncbi:MAG: hypothetical protein R3204_00370 [Oceanospirillum sp.]|nr:hypothetical protein [Oceanospirillum sp.]